MLRAELDAHGVDTLLLAGCWTESCVLSTAIREVAEDLKFTKKKCVGNQEDVKDYVDKAIDCADSCSTNTFRSEAYTKFRKEGLPIQAMLRGYD